MDLSRYYAEICRYKMFSKEEEADLFLEYADPGVSKKRQEQIRDLIIKSGMRFAFKQAKRFSKNDPEHMPELIAAANEGLVVGFNKFDPKSGYRYLSYSGWWVNQRILKQSSQFRIVSLPIYLQQVSARIQKFIESKETAPTFAELKEAFPDVSEKNLRDLSQHKYLTYFISDLGDDPAFEIDPIGQEVEVRLDRERIHAMIDTLPQLHRDIIKMAYGTDTADESTNATILKTLNITKEQLKDLKAEALHLLKAKLLPVNDDQALEED